MSKLDISGDWGRTWLLAAIIALIVLTSYEVVWRSRGFVPSVVDDKNLWSVEREKVGKSSKEIVLIGSSRSLSDISVEQLESYAGGNKVIQLAVDSSCANDALMDLGDDDKFDGLVLCDLNEECVIFGDEVELSIQKYLEHRKKTFNLNTKLNRQISTLVQENLVIMDPYLSFPKVFAELVLERRLRNNKYWLTHPNRSQSLDYTKLDIVGYRAKRIEYVNKRMELLESEISEERFLTKLAKLESAVTKIQSRGGKVVFIFLPMGAERWTINEKYFPKGKYWNLLAKATQAAVIHYMDIPGLQAFQIPDESHMDFRDKDAFTKALCEELARRRILEINSLHSNEQGDRENRLN